MISADKMKSVRIAPEIVAASSSSPRAAAGNSGSSWCFPKRWCTFSAPSKQRYAPPIIKIISTRIATNSLSTRAAGRMNTSLFFIEPIAILRMIGSSRSAVRPCTYAGVTAVSSMTTPAALTPARPAAAPTSSIDAAANLASAAMSSKRPTRPPVMSRPPVLSRWSKELKLIWRARGLPPLVGVRQRDGHRGGHRGGVKVYPVRSSSAESATQ